MEPDREGIMEENKEMELETGDEQEKDVLALLEDYFDAYCKGG